MRLNDNDKDGNPVDVCYPCWKKMNISDDVEHPDYDTTEQIYYCEKCGETLTSADN